MLTAFRPQSIIELKSKDKAKIESLLAYGDRVLVGLSSGALRVYRVQEPNQTANATQDAKAGPLEASRSELLHEEEKFSKRPIQQLAIVKEANLLLSLSDAHISLHDLQTYTLQERLDKTKGATTFAITSNVVKDADTQVPGLVSRLAVAVKRRILLWTWQDMELTLQAAEIAMSSTVKSLSWCSDSRIVVGMDPGFSIVDIETSEITDINKPDASGVEAAVPSGGVRFGAVNTTGMGYVGLSGWVPKPMATSLGNGQILLAKDVNTLFIDQAGKAIERRQIPWSFPPEAISYSYPYLLSLQSAKGILDIRNPDTSTLLQSIPVSGATILHVPHSNTSLAHAGKGFLVGSDRGVWRMLAVSYDSQVDELVAKTRYDEAVSLLSLLEDTLLDDKQVLIRDVQTRKAQSLFEQRKYQPALDLLAEAGAPPAKVIALYPQAIAGDLPSTSSSSAAPHETVPADKDTQLDETHKEIMSTSPENPRIADKRPATADSVYFDDPDELKTAVIALCGFLAQSRVQIQKYISNDGSLKTEVTVRRNSDALSIPFRNLIPLDRDADLTKVDWRSELHQVANLVDTTLFRAYMYARPQLAGPLFRLDNFCDPHVVEEKLYESGRYTDLVDFLHGKKLHRQALELLEKFGRNDAAEEVMPALRGPGRTVGYLQQLPPTYTDLILEFAKWPLETQSELGMEVFFADTENAEQLPRHRVVKFLDSIDSNLATTYLEHIINELNDQDADFHQDLVDRYIARLSEMSTELTKEAHSQKDSMREKLENFLRSTTQFNKGKTFRQLPASNPLFYESRAIVLSAMGNHKQALSIYVFQLHDYTKAEEYCQALHLSPSQPTPAQPSDTDEIYAVLLGLYLKPPQGQQTNWPQALELLSKHGARLPAKETLDLAPDDLVIAELASYFKGRIRSDNTTLSTGRVIVGLENARRTRLERELAGCAEMLSGQVQGRARKVVIRQDSHCKVCLRRFGNSAIKVYPDNRVVHYGCVGQGQRTR